MTYGSPGLLEEIFQFHYELTFSATPHGALSNTELRATATRKNLVGMYSVFCIRLANSTQPLPVVFLEKSGSCTALQVAWYKRK